MGFGWVVWCWDPHTIMLGFIRKRGPGPARLTKLLSVESSPGIPRWERFCTSFQGQKGSFAMTWPANLDRSMGE